MTDTITVEATCSNCGNAFVYRSYSAEIEEAWGPRIYCDTCCDTCTACPNCGQPAASNFHASENLAACPEWVPGRGWVPVKEDTAPCSDCGKAVDYIGEPWYAIDSGGLCVPCGKARGLSDEYLVDE